MWQLIAYPDPQPTPKFIWKYRKIESFCDNLTGDFCMPYVKLLARLEQYSEIKNVEGILPLIKDF